MEDSLSFIIVFSFVCVRVFAFLLYLFTSRTAFHLHEGRMQQVSAKWIYCRQHRCTCCRKLYFRQDVEFCINICQRFTKYYVLIQGPLLFTKMLCYFPSVGCFLFKEAQTAGPRDQTVEVLNFRVCP